MRNIALALLAAGGLAMAGTAPAEAVGTGYPYCLQGDDSPELSNCSFTSYAQCQATASGRMLYCVENPYFNAEGNYDPRPRRRGRVRPVYPAY